MDQIRFVELEYKIEHRHRDGTWSAMEEVARDHSPAGHDPERSWAFGRIFRCKRCNESVTITPGDESTAPESR